MRKGLSVVALFSAFVFVWWAVAFSAEETKTPGQLIEEAKAQIKEVTVQEAKKMMDDGEKVIFLDVRDKEEYLQGHLPGAIHMSRGALDFHVHEIIPDKDAKIVVI
jgi:predicted sulfurtransferase